MEENTRKRSRKSKLVVRDCSMDSDDELLVMQQEIEATLVQLKNKSILKKLSKPQITPKPVEPRPAVSVKVEVEEVEVDELNETRDSEAESSGIIIQSVTSLSEPPPLVPIPGTCQAQDEDKEEYFKFSEEAIRAEFEKLSRRTTNPADKLIEMHARNIFGRKRIPQETNYVDQRLTQIFRCKWKTWRNPFRDIREMPLLYKCYKCRKAWWHLYDFRVHILRHKKHKTMVIELQTNCHESYIIAYANRLHAHPTLEDPNLKYSIQSVCWRCGKDYSHHVPLYSLTNTRYRCSGCMERFYTCSLLFNHEHICALYRRSIAGSSTSFEKSCSYCPAKYSTEKELLQHMVLRHSVRSDIPEDWVLRNCSHCKYPFHLQVFHDCPGKPFITSCKFCAQKFTSHTFVLIHLNVTKHNFPCRICGSILRKECMELQHLMKHTQNYVIIYKCTYCVDPKYFPTVKSVNNHKAIAHKGRVENKNLGTFFDVTVVPKNMVKNMQNQWIFEEDTRNNLDNAYEGFLASLGQPNGTTEKKQKAANKDLEVNFFKYVKPGRLCKFTQNECQQTQQECVITIPDSPERIEADEVEIIEDSHHNDIIDISIPDDTQGIDMNSQECYRENVTVDIASLGLLQENYSNASDDSQDNNEIVIKTPEYSQDIVDIASPEPLQENDYNGPDDMHENNEIAMKTPEIKQEIVDIASPKPLQENDYNVPDDMQGNNEIVMKTPEIKNENIDIAIAETLHENDKVPDDMQENNEIVMKTPEIKQEIVDIASDKPLQQSDYNVPDDTQESNKIIMETPKIKEEIVDIVTPKPQQKNDKFKPDNTQKNTNEEKTPESSLENFDDYIKKSYILKETYFGRNFPNVVTDSVVNIPEKTYNNVNNIIQGNIEVKTEVIDEYDVNLNKDFQENEKTQETYTEDLNVIPPTEINEFDAHLVIKEENLNYNEITDNTQQEPVEMNEINTENLTIIKNEPMIKNSDTQCDNVNFDHCYTITDSNNKLITQIDKIILNTNMNNVGPIDQKLVTNINKLNFKVENQKLQDHIIESDKLKTNIINNYKLKAHNKNDKLKRSTVKDHLDDITRRAILALDKLRCKKPNSLRKFKVDSKRVEIKRKINKPKGEKKKDQFRKLDIIGFNELEANIAKMTGDENLEGKNESINQLNLEIKEEVGEEDFNNCTQELEEELEELMESDMIILDPRKCVSMEYEMDPATNASVISNEEDTRASDEVALDIESNLKRFYRCTKCSFVGIHQEYRQHLIDEDHHPIKRPTTKVCVKRPEQKPLHCSKCGRDFPSPYRYVSHFSKDHNYKPRTCPKCYHTFPTMHALHVHIISHVKENFPRMYVITAEHDEQKQHRLQLCQICSEPVDLADCFDHWERHLEVNCDAAQPEKKVLEPKLRIGNEGELKRMILLLQGINPDSPDELAPMHMLKTCVKCKRNFVRRNECKRHFIEHLLMDAVQHRQRHGFLRCQICADEFVNGERYKRHMREHGNLPLYKCDLCDKAFSDSSNFSKHKKVHNLSVVICDICNKKFTAKRFLEQHLRLHEVMDPLVCKECGKLFYSESSYRRHMRKGRAQFKCKVCYMQFNSVKNMWDHMWEEHRMRKFIADCPICHMSFRKHQDVRKHLREDHDNRFYKYKASKMVPRQRANRRPPRAESVAGVVVVAQDQGGAQVRKCGNSTAPKQPRAVKRKRFPVFQRVIALQDPRKQGTSETITRPAQRTASPVQATASPVQATASAMQRTAYSTESKTKSKQRKTKKRIRVVPCTIALQDPRTQGTPETINRPAQETASTVQRTASPVQRTASPVQGTASPVQGTASPMQDTANSMQGTAAPIQGTASPIPGTASLEQNTAVKTYNTTSKLRETRKKIRDTSPVQGTASLIQGTASLVQRTASSVQGTTSFVQRTASSVQGTASPVQETVVKSEPVESILPGMFFCD